MCEQIYTPSYRGSKEKFHNFYNPISKPYVVVEVAAELKEAGVAGNSYLC
jgi:hypothetical protein